MTPTTTTTITATTARPDVSELWAAHERQREEFNALSARHTALCDQAAQVHEAFTASAVKLRELFDAAYEAEFGRKYNDRQRDRHTAQAQGMLAAWRDL